MRNFGKALWGPSCSTREERTSNRGPCSLPMGGRAESLNRGRVGADQRVGPEGWLQQSVHPLVVLCAGITTGTMLLLLAPQKWQMVFCLFVPYCPKFVPTE